MFSRDVIKREVSSLFSVVAAWLRCGAGGSRTKTTLPPLPPPRGPWTGERGNASRTFPPQLFLPSCLPPSRFLGDRTAPARASGVNQSPQLVVVYLFTCNIFPPQDPLHIFAAGRVPAPHALLVARASLFFFLLVLFWLKVSRAKSDDSAAEIPR